MLINLPDGHWIDVPEKGYGIDYGYGDHATNSYEIVERDISAERVIEIMRYQDEVNGSPYTYNPVSE